MPILVILCLEKCITQRNRLNTLHIRVRDKLGIDIKEDGHIDCLSRIQPLLLKAEALDLAEIGRYLARSDRVCCYTNNVFGRFVRGRVKSQGGFAGQHADFALLRDKLPGKHVGDGAVKGDADAGVVDHRLETLGGVDAAVAAVGCGLDGLTSPAGLLADLRTCFRTIGQMKRMWAYIPSCTWAPSHML